MSSIKSFSTEMVKIAAEDTTKGYASRMVATLPLAIAKGFVDLPKGAVDKAVDLTIRTGKMPSLPKLVGRAVGRGGGTVGAGVFTTPMFFSGMKDLQAAKTKKERNLATAKILGAGFTYSAIKGAIETVTEKGVAKTKPKDVLRIARNIGGVRGVIGVGSAALTAKAITSTRKKKDSQDRVFRDAVSGGLVGAGKGALDELAERGIRGIKTPKGIRGVAARAGGRVASGMIGAVALGKLFDSYMKKNASENPKEPVPTPYSIYTGTRSKSAEMPTGDVYAAYSAHIANGDPEGTPTRRAVMYALTDTLRERGQPVKEEVMRNKVTGPKRPEPVNPNIIAAALAPQALLAITERVDLKGNAALKSAVEAQAAKKGIDIIQHNPDSFWDNLTGQGKYSGGADLQSRKIHVGPKASAEVLAHELGHLSAGNLRKTLLQNPAMTVRGYNITATAAMLTPLLTVVNASDDSFATKEELRQNKKIVDTVRAVATVGMAPRLFEEALASAKGGKYIYQAIRKSGKTVTDSAREAALRSIFKMGPGYMTYIAPLIIAGMASKSIGKQIENRNGA
jgi:hypothetical protein